MFIVRNEKREEERGARGRGERRGVVREQTQTNSGERADYECTCRGKERTEESKQGVK